jgi:hypothetical protein
MRQASLSVSPGIVDLALMLRMRNDFPLRVDKTSRSRKKLLPSYSIDLRFPIKDVEVIFETFFPTWNV